MTFATRRIGTRQDGFWRNENIPENGPRNASRYSYERAKFSDVYKQGTPARQSVYRLAQDRGGIRSLCVVLGHERANRLDDGMDAFGRNPIMSHGAEVRAASQDDVLCLHGGDKLGVVDPVGNGEQNHVSALMDRVKR